MKFNCICFFFVVFSKLFCFSQADTVNIYELSIEELMTLEVDAASMVEKDFRKQPVSLVSISRNQLELSGARTLADALSMLVPGFFIVEDQDDVILGFRGLAPDNNSKVMLMVNGQKMNTEWFWGPSAAILNSTNFGYIERVEVIRGSGSVTLGQGALLGVINVVTLTGSGLSKESENRNVSVKSFLGLDGMLGVQADAFFSQSETSGYVYFGVNSYNGQVLRRQGWARDKINEGFEGGYVVDIGTHLKRSLNNTLIGNFNAKGFEVNAIIVNHEQDLYNFYRDRNRFGETLISLAPSYLYKVSPNITVKASLDATVDNFSLSSVDGYTMGGTRENRYGVNLICNVKEVVNGNRLAFGGEFRHFEFGRSNFSGNNFINNVVTQELIDNQNAYTAYANKNKIWGYKDNINVVSAFAEDFQSLGNFIDLFAGIRFDRHPYWGTNLTPRIGTICNPYPKLVFRFSYQTGFRGAVGVHYGGGYMQDGLLSEDNFKNVQASQIPIFDESNQITGYEQNLTTTMPESMQGFELAADWNINKWLKLYGVGYYNIITNVIDVGVIWRDPDQFPMVNIGNDIPGDWNGYWFFKNTEGQIVQGGFESVLSFNSRFINASASHSHVRIIKSDIQQRGSMYITQKGNFKAYPENVTRFNFVSPLTKNLSLGCSYMFYYSWFSPSDQKVSSNHMLNAAISYTFFERLFCTLNCTNLLNQTGLYPMNSNVGDVTLSDGTPAVENTSLWLSIKYNF